MIVEFLEGNLFLDGWVLDASASGGRLEVLAGGRVFKLHPKRVLVSSEAADPGNREGRCALLEARGAARAELAGKIDLSVVWELLEEEHAAPEAAQDNEAPAGAGPAPDGGAPAGARPAPDGGAVAGARPAADGGASADGASGDAGPAVHAGHASQAEPADQAAPEGAAGETAGSARNEPRRAGSEAHSPYPYGALAEIEFGRGAGPDETAAVIRAVHGDGLYFKFTPEAALKRSREEIARILEDRARAARRAEQRREGILWLKSAREAYFGDTSETKAAAPAHGRGPVGPASDRRPLDASAQAPPAAFSRSAASSPHAAGPAYATPAAPPASPPAGPPAPRREVIPPPPDDGGELVRSLTELALCVEDPPPSLKAASEALSEAGFPADPAGAARALEAAGVFGPHEDLELRRLRLPLDFPAEVLDEAEALTGGESWLREDRLDLTGELLVTVDSPGAMEFDDALSLAPNPRGGLTLGIHIADAASLVLPGSALDRFASERGASIYLPEARHTMLPAGLTGGALSLSAGRVRPAFSILADVSPEGQVTDAAFRPSLVNVSRHLTFGEADRILSGGGDRSLAPLLEALCGLSRKFLKRRLAAGGHLFNIPAQQVEILPDGEPKISLVTWDTPASVAVGEIMIRANHLAATTLRNSDFPCPYRYQILLKQAPSPLSTKSRTPLEQLAWHLALRRRLGRTGISSEPSRHRGLGLDCYTYFTSPMRRYFDLLVHRQLRALAAGEGPAYDESSLMSEAYNADGLLRAIHKAQSSRIRYWVLHELSKREGETFRALCFDRQGRRVRLCLTDWMAETETASFPDSVEPGHALAVRLSRADPVRKALDCSFVANLSLEASQRP